MYAVIRTGGKQYRVAPGDTIKVEKLEGNAGDPITLDEVLLVAGGGEMVLGKPLVEGVKVQAEIVDQGRHRKVLVYKYKRRKRYRRKNGHRQMFTSLRINGIEAPGAPA